MEFQEQGRPLSQEGISRVCQALGVADPEVWAVLAVETKGFGFLLDRRPQILFERHIFRRLTGGKFDAGNSDISNKNPGGYVGGSGEYPRLEKAMGLDREAALQSASWGIGQVMGFNHKLAGFPTVEEMVTAMVTNEDGQLMAMAGFIKSNKLDAALQKKDWASFARGYNGADFKKNKYDTKLAAAHTKYKAGLPDLRLRAAQAALSYLGFDPGPVDGLRGNRTRAALGKFQETRGLPNTGDLDQETEARLLAEAFPSS